jgi:hypothetical protein
MNLRERAHFAWLDHAEAAETGLDARGIAALQSVLGDTSVTPETVKLDPFLSPPVALYRVDGLDFKVLLKPDDEPVTFVQRRQAWCPVSNLTELGKVFKDDPLPDEPPATAEPQRAEQCG